MYTAGTQQMGSPSLSPGDVAEPQKATEAGSDGEREVGFVVGMRDCLGPLQPAERTVEW